VLSSYDTEDAHFMLSVPLNTIVGHIWGLRNSGKVLPKPLSAGNNNDNLTIDCHRQQKHKRRTQTMGTITNEIGLIVKRKTQETITTEQKTNYAEYSRFL